jgi:hypothetical protein
MRESLGQERSKQQGRGLWKDWKRGIENLRVKRRRPRSYVSRIEGGTVDVPAKFLRKIGRKIQGLRNRAGTRSSRSNCTSSKEAAIPYHPGVAAGSQRCT